MKQRRCAAAWGRLALTLVLAAGGTAQETTHDTFVPIHGKAEDGTLKGVDAAGRVAIVRPEGAAATLDLGALRLIRLHKRHPTPIPRQGFVLLRSGLELPATAREGAERTVYRDVADLAAAGGEDVPPAWLAQLADGGRLVAPVHQGAQQALVVIDRDGERYLRQRCETVLFVPLKSGVE